MPDNARFYHAAYVATLVLYAAYTASIVWRRRAVARRRAALGNRR